MTAGFLIASWLYVPAISNTTLSVCHCSPDHGGGPQALESITFLDVLANALKEEN